MFDWDGGNEEHIARHGLTPDDVEEALLDPRRIGVAARNMDGERRWAVLGATIAGRVLLIVFTRRAEFVRVVTARDADAKQRRRYRRE